MPEAEIARATIWISPLVGSSIRPVKDTLANALSKIKPLQAA
jgi:hypothetical protein